MFRHMLIRLHYVVNATMRLMLFIPILLVSDHLMAANSEALNAQKEITPQQQPYRLLIVGDSLSAAYGLTPEQGWVSLLQNLWYNEGRKIDVINAAISGETTDGGLSRLPRLLDQHNPTHVLLELGGNDGLQGHPVGKMQSNLSKMVELAKQQGAHVYLQDMQIPTNFGRRYTEMFSNSFEKVANQHDVTLLPFFLQDIALDESLMQRDGIHPNAKGQPLIADFMYNRLTPLLFEH